MGAKKLENIECQITLGIFDSGLGGLTVAKEIRKAFPAVDLVYLGDTARLPYGIRSEETLHRYLEEGCAFLNAVGVNAIVLACNTLSSLLPIRAATQPQPLFGVIESGAVAAVQASKNGRVALLATDATVRSRAYEKTLKRIAPHIELFSKPAPLLVPLIEEGWLQGDVPQKVLRHYLEELLKKNVDTLILGCTHFPLLKPLIEQELKGTQIRIVDNGTALANELAILLPGLKQLKPRTGTLSVYVTDAPARFEEIAARFLGAPLEETMKVTI